ncbi:monovalent cation:proton antiporter-2 (CPA2) family protein [Mesorhizobium sp. YIM 152430]|uniref:monovalent cation:proton antiporter-2 (CPA2) family protein n=1 Tax=Mesorhizobium sp. YIM 152430 TaxID=3031761 RepID=UPI0023DB410C|nr:monovalent cation:proton antiporter-2 (CPA2) family protein [Mesorhizobium sp. YIM 152430]MDF1599985.1 monovalent cation:proton antiporter-2 (CPA2) family protein [Mesorhizobium sp. YIM 152430]
MAVETAHGVDLVPIVALLGAGVIAVPLFKRFGLDSVLGYLAAGIVIGPFGIGLFSDPQAIIHVAELGVVMFLFVIGLEMQPSRLWGLRREILGLGVLQVAICGALLTGAGIAFGFSPLVAFVAGTGFVLTSTAIVFQILNDQGELSTPKGQRIVSILLLEDIAIVPLLALVAFLAPGGEDGDAGSRGIAIAIALAAIAALVLVGRYLLNPLFRVLAQAEAREVMTAAALLVVLGSALLMQMSGLSMAMGAFLAGVLLSESTFRHQLEADIEPFRGILLGLFFLGVGMALDLSVIVQNAALVAGLVVVYMVLKGFGIYAIARLLRTPHGEALERAGLMAQGGEFAFVLFATAASVGVIDQSLNAIFTANVILSMILTPFVIMALRRLMPERTLSTDGVDIADGLEGSVLVIGFGRFGQIASQPLLLRGIDVSIIDNDVEMIQAASSFGFKVYFGDGTRLDILHAAGIGKVEAVMICVDKPEAAVRIAELIKGEYPLLPVLARAYDRGSAIALIDTGVEYQMRETLESAFQFGAQSLRTIGINDDEIDEIMQEVRVRDAARLDLQVAGGIYAGNALLRGNAPTPTPLATPRQSGQALSEETAAIIAQEREKTGSR